MFSYVQNLLYPATNQLTGPEPKKKDLNRIITELENAISKQALDSIHPLVNQVLTLSHLEGTVIAEFSSRLVKIKAALTDQKHIDFFIKNVLPPLAEKGLLHPTYFPNNQNSPSAIVAEEKREQKTVSIKSKQRTEEKIDFVHGSRNILGIL